ncbi:hypothetical protein QAD02_009898 [Eretmocerus hayati]|uniref:Uncharacterized protein n=1 Tax=Eretmocerus hayati TaxID=131215 RepID=A0ACC2NF66_9HYME|nr:hypothetical protein QAD02_009898 [Eretmocerus hayati]
MASFQHLTSCLLHGPSSENGRVPCRQQVPLVVYPGRLANTLICLAEGYVYTANRNEAGNFHCEISICKGRMQLNDNREIVEFIPHDVDEAYSPYYFERCLKEEVYHLCRITPTPFEVIFECVAESYPDTANTITFRELYREMLRNREHYFRVQEGMSRSQGRGNQLIMPYLDYGGLTRYYLPGGLIFDVPTGTPVQAYQREPHSELASHAENIDVRQDPPSPAPGPTIFHPAEIINMVDYEDRG